MALSCLIGNRPMRVAAVLDQRTFQNILDHRHHRCPPNQVSVISSPGLDRRRICKRCQWDSNTFASKRAGNGPGTGEAGRERASSVPGYTELANVAWPTRVCIRVPKCHDGSGNSRVRHRPRAPGQPDQKAPPILSCGAHASMTESQSESS